MTVRLLWSLLFAAALMLGGCPSDPPADDDDDDDDDVSDDDDDDDTGDDDDDTFEDDPVEPPDELAGQITLSYSESPGAGGVSREFRFDAEFATELTPASGVLVPTPSGMDTCAVAVHQDIDSFTPATYAYESAGIVTLSGAFGEKPTGPVELQDQVYYQMLLDVDDELEFGGTYGFDAEGDEFPGFESSIKLEMPEQLTLTNPSVGTPFNVQGDLDVTWQGGNVDTLWLFMSSAFVAVWPWETSEFGFLACEMTNDGSFTVPGPQLQQLPEGDATLTMVQTLTHYKQVDGAWLAFHGITNLTASGNL